MSVSLVLTVLCGVVALPPLGVLLVSGRGDGDRAPFVSLAILVIVPASACVAGLVLGSERIVVVAQVVVLVVAALAIAWTYLVARAITRSYGDDAARELRQRRGANPAEGSDSGPRDDTGAH